MTRERQGHFAMIMRRQYPSARSITGSRGRSRHVNVYFGEIWNKFWNQNCAFARPPACLEAKDIELNSCRGSLPPSLSCAGISFDYIAFELLICRRERERSRDRGRLRLARVFAGLYLRRSLEGNMQTAVVSFIPAGFAMQNSQLTFTRP